MELRDINHIHFTGIKGVGMTSLALCAQDAGMAVSGSDSAEVFVTAAILKKRNISYAIGFKSEHVPQKIDLLVYTGAHSGPQNPEVLAAQKRHIPCLSFAQALALFTAQKQTLALCGVGGKSTTSAMLATILEKAGLKPSYVIGVGNIPVLGSPGAYRAGSRYFVAEADEYVAAPGADDTPKFLYLKPSVIGVSNIEYDHPDVYPNLEATTQVYQKFFSLLPSDGTLVAFADNPTTLEVAKKFSARLRTYGSHPQADFRLTRYHVAQEKALCTFEYKNALHEFTLSVPGKFNAFNALCALAIALEVGVNPQKATAGLKDFTGTMRRFELIGHTKNGTTIIDDYAHHPSEIKATLTAAKDWFPGRHLTAVFQPHTYSRTKALAKDFAQSFAKADQVLFLPIYASAREAFDPAITSDKLASDTARHHPQVHSLKNPEAVLQFLEASSLPGSVIITLGAGDIYTLAHQISHSL